MSKPKATKAAKPAKMTIKPQITAADVISSTVRAYEQNTQNRYGQHSAAELCKRFTKYTKRCIELRAGALASVPFTICRRKKTSKLSAYSTKAIGSDRRRGMLASPGLGFQARKMLDAGDDLEIITDHEHPLRKILDDAWQFGNGYELRYTMEMHCCLAGNGYWAKIRDAGTGLPVELWPLHPIYTRVVPDKDEFISSFVYGRGTENEKQYARADVVRFNRPNPQGDPYYGYADIRGCIYEADLSMAFSQYALATLDNGVRPGMVISLPGATDAVRKQIEAAIDSARAGANNAGRSMVLSGPEKMQVLQWTEATRELSFLASEEKTRDAIANCLGVPLAFLSMDSAALAAAKEAGPMFQRNTIAPLVRIMEDAINSELTPDFRAGLNDESLIVIFENPVEKDNQTEATVQVSLYSAGLVTKNESRTAIGLDRVDDGDDFKADPLAGGLGGFGGFSMVDAPAKDKPKPDTAPAPEPDKDDGDVTDETKRITLDILDRVASKRMTAKGARVSLIKLCGLDADEADELVNANLPEEAAPVEEAKGDAPKCERCDGTGLLPGDELGEQVKCPDCNGEKNAETDEGVSPPTVAEMMFTRSPHSCGGHAPRTKAAGMPLADAIIVKGIEDGTAPEEPKRIVTTVDELDAALARWFAGLTGEVANWIDLNTGVVITPLADIPAVQAAFNTATAPHLLDVMRASYAHELNALRAAGREGEAQLVAFSERAAQVVRAYQGPMFRSIAETTQARVLSVLADAIENGATLPQQVGAINETLGPGSEYAATMIAQTEGLNAFHEARIEAWQDSGNVEGKRILLSGNPCDICRAMAEANQNVPVGKVILPTGGKVRGPGGEVLMVNNWMPRKAPPWHPHCGCGVSAVFSAEVEG